MSRLEKRTVKPITTKPSTAKQNVSISDLQALPIGGKFQAKSGNATGTIEKQADGSLQFTANCDSLILLVESLEIEVHHLRDTNTALVTKLKRKETIGLSGLQNFQIYGFRFLIGLIAVYIIYRKIKAKIIWKK